MENMKKLVLVLAIVFTFGITYAGNMAAPDKETKTEQVATADKDKKAKKAEKKGDCEKKCSEKKSCGDKE
jgi:hypothetical protein